MNWEIVREIRAQGEGVCAAQTRNAVNISRPFCCQIVRGDVWDPNSKLQRFDEIRDRIIGARRIDTDCRRGEMIKIQNKHVDWRHRWIGILKENSKTEVARVIPFEPGSRMEKRLRRRLFLGPDAYVFGEGNDRQVRGELRSRPGRRCYCCQRHRADASGGAANEPSNRKALAQIDLHWHDLRHETFSRLADDGVPVHELQLLAGHASITTTQRYMNARANSLAESMRKARAAARRTTRESRSKRASRLDDRNARK